MTTMAILTTTTITITMGETTRRSKKGRTTRGRTSRSSGKGRTMRRSRRTGETTMRAGE